MEITGKVYEVTPLEQGVSQNGQQWMKRTLVIQTTDNYPKTIAMTVFGQTKCLQLERLHIGQTVQASISLNSRKYEAKWYSEITCISFGVFQYMNDNQQQAQPPQPQYQNEQPPIPPTPPQSPVSQQAMQQEPSADETLPF